VPAEAPEPEEDLCNGLELHPPWKWDFLDPVSRAVVMPRCTSIARSLPVGTGASAPKDSTSLASLYISSTSVSPRGEYSSSSLSSLLALLWSSCCCSCSSTGMPWAPPPPMIHVVVHHAVAPMAVAHSEVLADQWVDDRCSCVRCGEYKSSII
jgi:hypothetical protein